MLRCLELHCNFRNTLLIYIYFSNILILLIIHFECECKVGNKYQRSDATPHTLKKLIR